MAALDSPQCRGSDLDTDPNNNFPSSMKGYSLRPRTTTRKCEEEDSQPDHEVWRPSKSKRKQKSMPLSKYRRKTANARERSRMREINEAFEALRKAIPQMASRECSSEKLTKITTLRLAMKYISALNSALHDQDLESDGESLFSDYTLTPPDVRDLSTTTSPAFIDHSDFLAPLLPAEIGASLMHVVDTPLINHLSVYSSDTSLPSLDTCMDVTHFTSPSLLDGNTSHILDDTQFLTEFS